MRDKQYAWSWDNAEKKQEIYWLRTALAEIAEAKFDSSQGDLELRVLTNLANAMSHMGRCCEAIDYWDQALAIDPNFAMALANRGDGLGWYARGMYDAGHQMLFLWQAMKGLAAGLAAGLESHAIQHVTERIAHLDTLQNWEEFTYDLDHFPRGRSEPEKNYRGWCLQNRLFLNPLNDLGPHNIAARDVMTFPSITQASEERTSLVPEVYGIYNQLVQEYVSARYLVFEAICERDTGTRHFSDNDVTLYDTLDYRVLRLWIEKLKMGFLSAFAMFDKMAYLLNHYLKLNIDHKHVNFGSLWFNKRRPDKGVRPSLEQSENWPLRGLFSLSRDFHWKADEVFSMEPDAKRLHEIRRHIAHKYLTVHDSFGVSLGTMGRDRKGNDLSMPIGDDDLAAATIKLLKLVRSAMIYLSLAANWHEQTINKNPDGLHASINLHPLGDDRL